MNVESLKKLTHVVDKCHTGNKYYQIYINQMKNRINRYISENELQNDEKNICENFINYLTDSHPDFSLHNACNNVTFQKLIYFL